jgi:hypothetical protein
MARVQMDSLGRQSHDETKMGDALSSITHLSNMEWRIGSTNVNDGTEPLVRSQIDWVGNRAPVLLLT